MSQDAAFDAPSGFHLDPGWLERLKGWARPGSAGDGRLFVLWPDVDQRLRPDRGGGRELLCLSAMPVRLFAHQRRAVERVVGAMGGRALLADEVGLGKTVEAGAVLKELWLLGRVRRALVLVPAALLAQWREELWRHCHIRACVHPCGHGWDQDEVVLTSLEYARLPARAEAIQAHPWDMVIVDEAHRLKNRASAGFRLVSGLRKTYLLLLTATPVHNHLLELYSLVSLLRPGQLGTCQGFRREFTAGPRTPRNVQRLRRLVAEVMVRTRRHEAGVRLPERRVATFSVALDPGEAELYRALQDLLWALARQLGARPSVLVLTVLLREAASSPLAVFATLKRLAAGAREREWVSFEPRLARLAERAFALAQSTPGPKIRWLVGRLDELARSGSLGPGRLVAFTEFAATARLAARVLRRAGVGVVLFHGRMGEAERARALATFERRAPVMVSTDAGSEGHNLHFCRELVNLDLPWNPMRLEQRIGRLHRIGQAHPVTVANLAAAGTVEQYVLTLIYEKLGMFKEVVGDLDEVVASVPGGLEGQIRQIAATSSSEGELKMRLERLGHLAARRSETWRQARALTSAILDGAAEVRG